MSHSLYSMMLILSGGDEVPTFFSKTAADGRQAHREKHSHTHLLMSQLIKNPVANSYSSVTRL